MPNKTSEVPVSHPSHPSHVNWLEIIMTALRAAATIGPAVVAIADPEDAGLAVQLGNLTNQSLDGIPSQTPQ